MINILFSDLPKKTIMTYILFIMHLANYIPLLESSTLIMYYLHDWGKSRHQVSRRQTFFCRKKKVSKQIMLPGNL